VVPTKNSISNYARLLLLTTHWKSTELQLGGLDRLWRGSCRSELGRGVANDIVVVVVAVKIFSAHPIRGLGVLDRRIVANQNSSLVNFFPLKFPLVSKLSYPTLFLLSLSVSNPRNTIHMLSTDFMFVTSYVQHVYNRKCSTEHWYFSNSTKWGTTSGLSTSTSYDLNKMYIFLFKAYIAAVLSCGRYTVFLSSPLGGRGEGGYDPCIDLAKCLAGPNLFDAAPPMLLVMESPISYAQSVFCGDRHNGFIRRSPDY